MTKSTWLLVIIASLLSVSVIVWAGLNGYTIAYGDAESHLNIAKRIVHSLTPGLAQLGGVWLPLPHLLMVPFVWIDSLWRSGVAGALVGGLSYVITCVYIYKLIFFVTHNQIASWVGSLTFGLNPNVLYMQATPMTEVPLIMFFVVSIYYFLIFLKNYRNYRALILAALFAFAASLSRYDGWLLVLIQAGIIGMLYVLKTYRRPLFEGNLILYSTLAGFGIVMWLLWDGLIFGDPLYFKNSPFSANSQQKGWLARGELPAYGDIKQALTYYTVTSAVNTGAMVAAAGVVGALLFILNPGLRHRSWIFLMLFSPFAFYVLTLYIGQSIIFIPQLTPDTFEWQMFNVRYGIMMVPFAAFFLGYLYFVSPKILKPLVVGLLIAQLSLFISGKEKVVTFEDGVNGLSSAKHAEAGEWLSREYDDGLVLLDDYARTISVIRTSIPMEKVIYVGNKPFWEESLREPEKYASWIVMQQDDSVWSAILNNPDIEGRLYKYFQKVYTSPEILIFKKI